MSEPNTNPTPDSSTSTPPIPPSTSDIAASLFPEGADSSAAPESTPASDGGDTLAGDEGADSVAGPDTTPGAEYEFTFPDNFTPSDDLVAEARTVLADAGVPKDKAQSVIDLYVKTQTAANQAAEAAFNAQQQEWQTQINAMPEFQGATRSTSLEAIGRVLDEFGPEAKAGIMSNPLVGNNPEMVKFMLNLSKVLTEGSATPTGRPPPNGRDGRPLAGRSLGQVLFSSDNPSENSVNAR